MIFLGKSKCPLYSQILVEADKIWGLPPISDTSNPLYHYFDEGFHKSCFENWERKNEVELILKKEISD